MIELSMVYDKIQVENEFSELSTTERQEILMKKAKLIGMLDEVCVVHFDCSVCGSTSHMFCTRKLIVITFTFWK